MNIRFRTLRIARRIGLWLYAGCVFSDSKAIDLALDAYKELDHLKYELERHKSEAKLYKEMYYNNAKECTKNECLIRDLRFRLSRMGRDLAAARKPTMSDPITVLAGSRMEHGSCNGCQRRDKRLVFVIECPTIAIRVCEDCADSLVKQLKSFKHDDWPDSLWDALRSRLTPVRRRPTDRTPTGGLM